MDTVRDTEPHTHFSQLNPIAHNHGLGTIIRAGPPSPTPLSLEVAMRPTSSPSTSLTKPSKLAPLLILLVVLALFAFVGYHLYLTAQKISSATSDKMQAKNVVFTKDGLKVGVKDVRTESYVDTTQSFLVKAWNLSTWPEYKSRLWNKQPPANGTKVDARKS